MRTRVGEITFAVPQVREGGFYPQALEKGLRSERALTLALAEMYVQGVSTRKVKAITEQLCGTTVSSAMVSQAAAQMDEELAKWRERPLGEYPYLFLDAYYGQVREDGQVRHLAVLVAVAVTPQGKREILGVSVSLSEHEVHWRTFLESLKKRGSGGIQLITSDDHAGLRAARLAVRGADLQGGVHFDEDPPVLIQELDRAGRWTEIGAPCMALATVSLIVCAPLKCGRRRLHDLLASARPVASSRARRDAPRRPCHRPSPVIRCGAAGAGSNIFRGRGHRRRTPPSKYFARAVDNALGRSSSVRATFMPRPPPPAAAFTSTGKPMSRAMRIASSLVVTAPGDPGTTGMPSSGCSSLGFVPDDPDMLGRRADEGNAGALPGFSRPSGRLPKGTRSLDERRRRR